MSPTVYSVERAHASALPRRRVAQFCDDISFNLPASSLCDPVDPKDGVERLAMQNGLFERIASEEEFARALRVKAVNDAEVPRSAWRGIAKLKKYHWLVRKQLLVRKLRVQQVIRIVCNGGGVLWTDGEYIYRPAVVLDKIELSRAVYRSRAYNLRGVAHDWLVQVLGRWPQVQNVLQKLVDVGCKAAECLSAIIKVCGRLPVSDEFGNGASGPYLVDEKTGFIVDPAIIGDEALVLIANSRKRRSQVDEFDRSVVLVFDSDTARWSHDAHPASCTALSIKHASAGGQA